MIEFSTEDIYISIKQNNQALNKNVFVNIFYVLHKDRYVFHIKLYIMACVLNM